MKKKTVKLYEQVANDITGLIEAGTFRPGERIPSVRHMSAQRKVSVTTILQAYSLLEDHGLIEARPQSGFYVRARLPIICPEPKISTPEPDPTKVSMRELTMMVMKDLFNPKLVPLGAAIPNHEMLPEKKLSLILASLARRKGGLGIRYDTSMGCEELRVQIARQMLTAGSRLSPNDIMITSGCIDAVNLCLRAVCRPGDTVAIESPTYFGILQSMDAMDLQALEIPTHPRNGISLEALGFATEQTPVQACLVISNFNNPLGSCLPDPKKKKLVEMLGQRRIPLIEVDTSGELYYSEPRPSVCKAYDRQGMVMLCSSFSKTICPGYRVGWVTPGKFKSTIEWLKFTSNLAVAYLPQMAVAEYLDTGGYRHHMRRVRRTYALNVSRMIDAIMTHFPKTTRVTRPKGGFVLWVQMPENVDSLVLYKQALRAGITLSPGYLFSPSQRFKNFIRLNAAFWSEEIERAIIRLGDLIHGISKG